MADALDQPFPDGKFDLVWSMESGEHMPDKKKVPSLRHIYSPRIRFFFPFFNSFICRCFELNYKENISSLPVLSLSEQILPASATNRTFIIELANV